MTGDEEGGVKLWEIKSGALLRSLNFPIPSGQSVQTLIFNGDDSAITATLRSGPSQSWETKNGTPIIASPTDPGLDMKLRKHAGQLTSNGESYAISPDNHYVAIARLSSDIEIWDSRRKVIVKKFGRPREIFNNYAAPLAEGTILQISNSSALTWNTQTGALHYVNWIHWSQY